MTNINISEISIRNFRSIQESTVCLSHETIVIGKNNIGKTSLLEIFSAFDNKLKISDININLLRHILQNKEQPSKLTPQDCIELKLTYDWLNLPVEYWTLLTDISDKGATVIKFMYQIPEENYEQLKNITSINELINLFVRRIYIGSKNDFIEKHETLLPPNMPISKLLPVSKGSLKYLNSGELLLCPIMAFRYVNTGKNSNDEATSNQFSSKISELLSKSTDTQELFDEIQTQIDNVTATPMETFQNELKQFAYPKNPDSPLQAILTIDEWMKNPKVRISQTFSDLNGFELPLKAQGLGYQNIYPNCQTKCNTLIYSNKLV